MTTTQRSIAPIRGWEGRVVPPELAEYEKRGERGVLAHLVVDRTYVEIATALFINEKTVRVHVSNMLRKTDTSSHRELAALVRRLDSSAAADEG